MRLHASEIADFVPSCFLNFASTQIMGCHLYDNNVLRFVAVCIRSVFSRNAAPYIPQGSESRDFRRLFEIYPIFLGCDDGPQY